LDIRYADEMKLTMRLALWWLKREFKKKYKVTIKDMQTDLETAGNPAIAELYDCIIKESVKIEEKYQKRMAVEFPTVILWAMYKDTAYLPPFMYILAKILRRHETLLPKVERYYQEPEDWYVNVWKNTKDHTKEMKAEGSLPDIEGILSPDENIFVPPKQQIIVNKINKDIKAQEKKNKQRIY